MFSVQSGISLNIKKLTLIVLFVIGGASQVSTRKYVNIRDVANYTALHLACRKGHVAVARLCVSHGADANAEEEGSLSSPVHFAAASGVAELVELLVENGAQIDFRDEHQRTPLHRWEL
mgnify:CR=1 FL=1